MMADPDFAGLRVVLMQTGPHAYVVAVETEHGEELGRSIRPSHSPQAALDLAIESIEAHQTKGAAR